SHTLPNYHCNRNWSFSRKFSRSHCSLFGQYNARSSFAARGLRREESQLERRARTKVAVLRRGNGTAPQHDEVMRALCMLSVVERLKCRGELFTGKFIKDGRGARI